MPSLPLLALLAAPALATDEPPVALAGRAFLAYPDERIILDGSESYDPEGYELTWQWTQVHGPAVQLRGYDTPNPEFDAAAPGVHSFELVVDDGIQESDPDVVDVIVLDPAIGAAPAGGCSAAPGAGAAGLLLPLLGLLRRRR